MTNTSLAPHLNFRGQAREVLSFYRSVLGGDLALVTYGDAQAAQDPAQTDEILFGQLTSPGGLVVMAYDVQRGLAYDQGVNSLYLSLRCATAEEVQAFWAGLREGAEIEQDLGPSGWSPLYGKLRDRFGVVWVIDLIVP